MLAYSAQELLLEPFRRTRSSAIRWVHRRSCRASGTAAALIGMIVVGVACIAARRPGGAHFGVRRVGSLRGWIGRQAALPLRIRPAEPRPLQAGVTSALAAATCRWRQSRHRQRRVRGGRHRLHDGAVAVRASPVSAGSPHGSLGRSAGDCIRTRRVPAATSITDLVRVTGPVRLVPCLRLPSCVTPVRPFLFCRGGSASSRRGLAACDPAVPFSAGGRI